MTPSGKAVAETNLLIDLDKIGYTNAYRQLIEELPIADGEKILTLYRGAMEATKCISTKNPKGHLYIILGEDEQKDEQVSGWSAGGNLTFLYTCLTDLPLPDASLNRVVMVYLPELFQSREKIVQEVCRVLRPGGVFNILYFDHKEKGINGYYFEIKKEDYLAKELITQP